MENQERAKAIYDAVYSGTTYSQKKELVAQNDNYILIKKKSSTEYIGGTSGSVHSVAHFLVFNLNKDFDLRGLKAFPKKFAEFYKEGGLTKEEKLLIKNLYNLEIKNKKSEKVERFDNKIIVLVRKNNLFSYGDYCGYNITSGALISDNGKDIKYKDLNSGKEHSIIKSNYYYKIIDNVGDNYEIAKSDFKTKVEGYKLFRMKMLDMQKEVEGWFDFGNK